MKIIPIKGRDCVSHAKAMARANPDLLTYVTGKYRSVDCRGWVSHGWCETKGGQIVDIYGILYHPELKFKYGYRKP